MNEMKWMKKSLMFAQKNKKLNGTNSNVRKTTTTKHLKAVLNLNFLDAWNPLFVFDPC